MEHAVRLTNEIIIYLQSHSLPDVQEKIFEILKSSLPHIQFIALETIDCIFGYKQILKQVAVAVILQASLFGLYSLDAVKVPCIII